MRLRRTTWSIPVLLVTLGVLAACGTPSNTAAAPAPAAETVAQPTVATEASRRTAHCCD